MRICWRWTVFKLGQMLWAWFSWWNKLFPLLPVRFSWPATISGGWKGLVYCRPIPILFSFFKPAEELTNLFAFVFEIEPLLKQIQYTSSITVNYTGLLIGHGRKSQISRKNRLISREFRSSFRGKLHQKSICKKWPILWLFSGQISLEIDQFCADQTSICNVFSKKGHHLLFQQQYAPEMNQWQGL